MPACMKDMGRSGELAQAHQAASAQQASPESKSVASAASVSSSNSKSPLELLRDELLAESPVGSGVGSGPPRAHPQLAGSDLECLDVGLAPLSEPTGGRHATANGAAPTRMTPGSSAERHASGATASDVSSLASSHHWGSEAGSNAPQRNNSSQGGLVQAWHPVAAMSREVSNASGYGEIGNNQVSYGAVLNPSQTLSAVEAEGVGRGRPGAADSSGGGLLSQVMAAIEQAQGAVELRSLPSHSLRTTSAPLNSQTSLSQPPIEPRQASADMLYSDDDFESPPTTEGSEQEPMPIRAEVEPDAVHRLPVPASCLGSGSIPCSRQTSSTVSRVLSSAAPSRQQSEAHFDAAATAVEEEELVHGWSPYGRRPVDQTAYDAILRMERAAEAALEPVAEKELPATVTAFHKSASLLPASSDNTSPLLHTAATAMQPVTASFSVATPQRAMMSAPGAGTPSAARNAVTMLSEGGPRTPVASTVRRVLSESTAPAAPSLRDASESNSGTIVFEQVVGQVGQGRGLNAQPSHNTAQGLTHLLEGLNMTKAVPQRPMRPACVSAPGASFAQVHVSGTLVSRVSDAGADAAPHCSPQFVLQPAGLAKIMGQAVAEVGQALGGSVKAMGTSGASASTEDAVDSLKLKALAYLTRFQRERSSKGLSNAGEGGQPQPPAKSAPAPRPHSASLLAPTCTEASLSQTLIPGVQINAVGTRSTSLAGIVQDAGSDYICGTADTHHTWASDETESTQAVLGDVLATRSDDLWPMAAEAQPARQPSGSAPQQSTHVGYLLGAGLPAAAAVSLEATLGATCPAVSPSPSTLHLPSVGGIGAVAEAGVDIVGATRPVAASAAASERTTLSSGGGATTKALLDALGGIGISLTNEEGQPGSLAEDGPMQALLQQLHYLEPPQPGELSAAVHTTPHQQDADSLLRSSGGGAESVPAGRNTGPWPTTDAALEAQAAPRASSGPRGLSMSRPALPAPSHSVAVTIPSSPPRRTVSGPVSPTTLSRLSQATTASQPIPTPPIVPTSLATMLAVADLPSSAAEAMSRNARQTGASSPAAISCSTTPASSVSEDEVPHSSSWPTVMVRGGYEAQQQQAQSMALHGRKSRDEDITDLLQRLSASGYNVPPHAALVLGLIIDEATEGSEGMSTAAIAAELRVRGAPPRTAGWSLPGRGSGGGRGTSATTGVAGHALMVPSPSNQSLGELSVDPQQGSLPTSTRPSTSGGATGSIASAPVFSGVAAHRVDAHPRQTLPTVMENSYAAIAEAERAAAAAAQAARGPSSSGVPPAHMSGSTASRGRPSSAPRDRPPSAQWSAATGQATYSGLAVQRPDQGIKDVKGSVHTSPQHRRRRSSATLTSNTSRAKASSRVPEMMEGKDFSLLQEWRSAKQQAAAHQQQLGRAIQHAPCSPGKAAAAHAAALNSKSPLLGKGRAATPDRIQPQALGSRGEYRHDAAGGVITLSGQMSTEAWRTHQTQQLPQDFHPSETAHRTVHITPDSNTQLRATTAKGGAASKRRSATATTPRTGSSPLRPRAAPKTPPKGSALGVNSILDALSAAAPVASGGADVPGLGRLFAWQERDTRSWLVALHLEVLPHEEAAPFLENPLRNGILLCDVAAAVTGHPVRRVVVPPASVREARANILVALDHLGLLGDIDEEQMVQLLAPPAEEGRGASGTQRSQSTGRGYAHRLKAKQVCKGLGIIAEVEKVLQGNRDSIWALLNHVRETCTSRQAFLGPTNHLPSAATAATAAEQRLLRRSASVPEAAAANLTRALSKGKGKNSVKAASPRDWAVATSAAIGSITGPIVAGTRGDEVLGRACMIGSGVGPCNFVVGPLQLSAVHKEQIRAEAERDAAAARAAEASVAWEAAARPPGAGTHHLASVLASPPHSPHSLLPPHTLLVRPTHPDPALPYSPEEVVALEASLLRWLVSLGGISRHVAVQGFGSLLEQLADGVFLCWLAGRITGKVLTGVNKKPLNEHARRANIARAIEALRNTPGMTRRWLNHEEALLVCSRPAMTGLLEDMHRLADAQAPAPSILQPGTTPYLPFTVTQQSQGEATVPSELLALMRGSSTAPPAASLLLTPDAEQQHRGSSHNHVRPSSAPRGRQMSANGVPTTPTHAYITSDGVLVTPTNSQRRPASSGRQRPTSTSRTRSGAEAGIEPWSPAGIARKFVTPTKVRPTEDPGAAARARERRAAAGMAGAPRLHSSMPQPSASHGATVGAAEAMDAYLRDQQTGMARQPGLGHAGGILGSLPTLTLIQATRGDKGGAAGSAQTAQHQQHRQYQEHEHYQMGYDEEDGDAGYDEDDGNGMQGEHVAALAEDQGSLLKVSYLS